MIASSKYFVGHCGLHTDSLISSRAKVWNPGDPMVSDFYPHVAEGVLSCLLALAPVKVTAPTAPTGEVCDYQSHK